MYYFDPGRYIIKEGAGVIVETSQGVEYADVVIGTREVSDAEIVAPLKGIMRVATPKDAEQAQQNRQKEQEALALAEEKIKAHNLDMKLVRVEYTFDGAKIVFYFTSEGRVDFRELVKDLASAFRTRIELRQIGARDEAKMLASLLLQPVFVRFSARIHQNGQGTGAFPQPHQNQRALRTADVLP